MKYCGFSSKRYFEDIHQFAEDFLEDIFFEAEDTVNENDGWVTFNESASPSSSERLSQYCFERSSKTFQLGIWPTVGEFTVESGARSINGFLSSLYMMEEWTYAIYYINKIEEPCSDLYQYQVIWSIPTALFPIAQVTASTYFTIEVSRIVSRKCQVQVSFQFETNGFVHSPNDIMEFDDERLNWILDAKLAHFSRFKF